jgi:hypothetical protein
MLNGACITNPYSTYRRLRDAAALHWTPEWRTGARPVPRYADAAAALRDSRVSSRRDVTDMFPSDVKNEVAALRDITSAWMLLRDPPQHGRVRTLLSLLYANTSKGDHHDEDHTPCYCAPGAAGFAAGERAAEPCGVSIERGNRAA